MTKLSWLPVLALLVGCPKTTAPVEAPVEAAPAPAPSVEIRKNDLDDREFRYFELDNGMKVVVIQDADADKGAAALDVHIGQFSDPVDRQGLAHFLEHMLFMGTDKYPDVDGYRKFIQDNGGGSNAGTGQEHTTYFFDIDKAKLEPALDRFAQFFVAPKLDPEYVDKERNAVNNEYSLKIKDDARRIREVKRATSNPEHPFRKFSVGNLETLADRGEDDMVWDDLKALYESAYSASRMTLAIVGTDDLDTLEAMARSKFSAVPSDGKPYAPATVAAYTPDQLKAEIHITPLKDMRNMEIQFPAPSTYGEYQMDPTGFIAEFIDDESEGSLYSVLKAKGWIEGLGMFTQGTEDYALPTIDVDLTPEGYAHRDEIVTLVFQTLNLIKAEGVVERYHAERSQLAKINFAFMEPGSPNGTANQAVNALAEYPPEHMLDFWASYGDFDAELVKSYLDKMVPDNMRIMVIGPDLETDQVEPLYDTPYQIKPIAEDRLAGWRDAGMPEGITLPEPNAYIASDLGLKGEPNTAQAPTLVHDEGGLRVWHGLDNSFGVPKAQVVASLRSGKVSSALNDQMLNQLFAACINDALEASAYPVTQAGLVLGAGASSQGLELYISGYNDKQATVATELARQVAELTIDEATFNRLRDAAVRDLRNEKRARPINQTARAVGVVMDPARYTAEAKADATEKLTLAKLQAFQKDYFSAGRLQVLAYGNTDVDGAKAIGTTLHTALLKDAKVLEGGGTVARRTLKPGTEVILDVDIDHADSTFIGVYLGKSFDNAEYAKFRMLGAILRTPFFGELRTKQQLGYIASAYATRSDKLPALQVLIQSSSVGPNTLQERIDTFLVDYAKVLAEMPEAEFNTIRDGLIADLLEKDPSLSRRAAVRGSELYQGETGFTSREDLAKLIGALTKDEMVAFYDATLLSKDRSRLIGRNQGKSHPDETIDGCKTPACAIKKMGKTVERTLE